LRFKENKAASPTYIDEIGGKKQYRIRLKGTDLFLIPSDHHGATNSPIIIQPEQAGDLQEGVLIEQHPTMHK
jgi:hypothetical protein